MMITFPDVSVVFTFQQITPLDSMQPPLQLPTAMIAVLLLATRARRPPVEIARIQDLPTIRVTLTVCARETPSSYAGGGGYHGVWGGGG